MKLIKKGATLEDSIRAASLIKKAGTEPEFVAGIVDKNIKTDNKEILFYRQLLSGVLDPDKLDYLNRDAFYCGVPYGIQDTEFTLAALEPDLQKGITINSKSIVAVENLLFSKYLMYRTVYWHKTVRIVTAMMKKTLFSALKNDEISDTPLQYFTTQPPQCQHLVFQSIGKFSPSRCV